MSPDLNVCCLLTRHYVYETFNPTNHALMVRQLLLSSAFLHTYSFACLLLHAGFPQIPFHKRQHQCELDFAAENTSARRPLSNIHWLLVSNLAC